MESVDAKKLITRRGLGLTLFLLWPLLYGIFVGPLGKLTIFVIIVTAIWGGSVIILYFKIQERYWFALYFSIFISFWGTLYVFSPSLANIASIIIYGTALIIGLIWVKLHPEKVEESKQSPALQFNPSLPFLFLGSLVLSFFVGMIIGAILNVK